MSNSKPSQDDYTKIPATDGTGTKLPALISADIQEVAAWFCNLDHEDQAQFFLEASKIAETWQGQSSNQWWWVGREISLQIAQDKKNKPAVDMLNSINDGLGLS
jgi:uncharacterized protein YacL (UPF0231 family)